MKKFIQIFSLVSMLVLFSALATFAQSGFGSDVNIPFAFNIGDRSYEAGNYIVKLDRRSSGSATLSIQDTKTDKVHTMILNVGPHSTSGEINLVFDMFNGQRYLTKISTPERTFALVKSKSEKEAIKAQSSVKPVETAIVGGGANLF
jgi:hypothetical protein